MTDIFSLNTLVAATLILTIYLFFYLHDIKARLNVPNAGRDLSRIINEIESLEKRREDITLQKEDATKLNGSAVDLSTASQEILTEIRKRAFVAPCNYFLQELHEQDLDIPASAWEQKATPELVQLILDFNANTSYLEYHALGRQISFLQHFLENHSPRPNPIFIAGAQQSIQDYPYHRQALMDDRSNIVKKINDYIEQHSA